MLWQSMYALVFASVAPRAGAARRRPSAAAQAVAELRMASQGCKSAGCERDELGGRSRWDAGALEPVPRGASQTVNAAASPRANCGSMILV